MKSAFERLACMAIDSTIGPTSECTLYAVLGAFLCVISLDHLLADEKAHVGHARHRQMDRDEIDVRRIPVDRDRFDELARCPQRALRPVDRKQYPWHALLPHIAGRYRGRRSTHCARSNDRRRRL